MLFGPRADDARLAALGYLERDGLWWKRGAMQEYTGPARFFQLAAPTAFDGARDEIEYDVFSVVRRWRPRSSPTIGGFFGDTVEPWSTSKTVPREED